MSAIAISGVSKAYGQTPVLQALDIEVQDERGHPCELATLNGDGHTLSGHPTPARAGASDGEKYVGIGRRGSAGAGILR